jgi:hypothetical protein
LISIDCHELTVDEQLALAGELTGGLQGRTVALVKGEEIVLDEISSERVRPEEVRVVVQAFVSRRKDARHYSVERDSDLIIVHSSDPLARGRGRKEGQLPPNLLKCPFCSFVTPYQEMYNIHVRSHGFAAPV